MALELVYTSAERGLRAGTSGFCTVAMTRGMPPALVPRLEALGGYRPGPSGDGPRAHCFWRVETAGSVAHVLAVVGPAPPDHTQRTNKIATYLVLGQDELVPAGPAWLIAQRGLVRAGWSGAPAWIEAPVRVPASGPAAPQRCSAWEAAAGDPGWAGVVASAFLRDQSKPIHVVWREGMDPLALVGEVLSLMPDWARWRATFSTYFLQPVAGTPCALRLCLDGTPAADAARQSKGMLIDLARPLGPATDSRFARMARTGIDEEAVAREAERARRATRQREAGARSAAGAAAGQEREIGLEPVEDLPERPDARRARPLPEEEPVVEQTDDAEPGDGRRWWLVVRVVSAVLLFLVLGLALFFALQWKDRVNSAIDDVTGGTPSAPAVPVDQSTPEPAVTPEPEIAATPEPATSPDPTPEPATSPDPAPASEPEPTPATAPSPEPAPAPEPTPEPMAAAPAPARALPAGLVGARWSLRRDATSGGANAALRWSTEINVPAGKDVAFRVPDSLVKVGVVPDARDLTVADSKFRARASLDGKQIVVAVQERDAMPAVVAAALGQSPGSTSTESWSALLAAVTIDVVDAAGTVLGQAQCRGDSRREPLVAGGQEATVPDAPALLLVAQVVKDPGAPSQRSVRSQSFVDPGGSCALDATALVRVTVDRGASPGRIVMRAEALPPAERNARAGAITVEFESLRALIVRLESLARPVTGASPDSAQVAAFAEALPLLGPEERERISAGSTEPPATAQAMREVHELVVPRLRARRDALQVEIAELTPRKSDPLKMFLRVSTTDGAIVAERPIELGGKP
jgi:hypothetical protein